MTVVLILGSTQLILFGLLGEYIGRLYLETKRRPLFVIDQVLTQTASTSTQYPGQPVMQSSNDYSYTLEFYLQAPVTTVDIHLLQQGRLPHGDLLYASANELRPFDDKFQLLHRTASFSVSHPRPAFLNAATRDRVIGESWLVRIQ